MAALGRVFRLVQLPGRHAAVIRVLPLTALNEALRAVMLEARRFRSILPQLSLLAVWGLLSFAVALRIFRWR